MAIHKEENEAEKSLIPKWQALTVFHCVFFLVSCNCMNSYIYIFKNSDTTCIMFMNLFFCSFPGQRTLDSLY